MQFLRRYYYVYVLAFSLFCSGAILVVQWFAEVRQTSAALPLPAVVVIDPGHGGEDGGAVSARGTKESELNLAIGLRLRDLCVLLGIPTRMLRTEDVMLCEDSAQSMAQRKVSDLRQRVKLVNETPGALLVSIHQNSFPQGTQYRGAQVFFAPTEGSQALAEALQGKLCDSLDSNNHRVCKPIEGVYLMEHVDCTAILLECGFLTNTEEEALLRSPDYQKKLVCVLAATLTEYLENTT